MTMSTLIYQKLRSQEKRNRAFIFLLSKLILVSIFSNLYLREGIDKLFSFQFDRDVLVAILTVAFLLYVVTFALDKLEDRYLSRANNDEEFRKKILEPMHFIEGRWFIATIENGIILEYAVAKIEYINNRLNLVGDLFKIDKFGNPFSFGHFISLVGEFFPESQKFIYAYERKSSIEINDDKYQTGESYGKGEYFFQFDHGAHTRLKGGYFDPVSDSLRELRGISVALMREKYGLSSDLDMNSENTVKKMHDIFLKITPGYKFQYKAEEVIGEA